MQIRSYLASCDPFDLVWKVQIGTIWVFALLTIGSALPKTEPLWWVMCSFSISVGIVEWMLHEKLRHENALRAIDVDFWAKQRTIAEKAKEASDASFERNRELLKGVEDEIADMNKRRQDWKREVNSYARQTGQPLPFPSADVASQPPTKN